MKVKEIIFEKDYEGQRQGFRFSDLPQDLRPDDYVVFESMEGQYFSDSACDAHSILKVIREREETPEEEKKRIDGMNKMQRESFERDVHTFQKLKKRFESRDELIAHLKVKKIDDVQALWAEAKDYYASKGKEMGGSFASWSTDIHVKLKNEESKQFDDKWTTFRVDLNDLN